MADDHDLVVRHAPIRRADVTLDHDALEALIGPRTRVVAFTLASNAVGSLTDPRASPPRPTRSARWPGPTPSTWLRTGGSRATEWGLDVLLCSPYKFFGPHLGVAAIRADLAARCRPTACGRQTTHPPATASRRARSRTRPRRHRAAIDYLRSIGDGSLDLAFERIRAHEDEPVARVPGHAARRRRAVRDNRGRGAHADFLLQRARAASCAGRQALAEQDIYVWDGDYYALEPMRALGLDQGGGAVRAGCLHYTSIEEIRRLVLALGGLTRI